MNFNTRLVCGKYAEITFIDDTPDQENTFTELLNIQGINSFIEKIEDIKLELERIKEKIENKY